jgi:uncharacterized protein
MDNQTPASDLQSAVPPQQVQTPKKTFNKVILGILLLFVAVGGVAYFLFNTAQQSMPVGTTKQSSSSQPTTAAYITPVPFYDMTVPALRERKYTSSLREMTELSDNGIYASYLTSYESDGFRVNGLLTRPDGEVPDGGWPAIVFIHGYIPPTQYVTTEKYVDYIDYLARNGFVVFKIDLRGHGQSEGEAGGGYFGSDYVVDALNAQAALAATDFVNPKKIGFWGHSMAGNVVMRAMAARPETQAGVIWAGAVYTYLDMQKYRINDSSYQPPANNTQRQNRRRELFEKHGSPSAQSTFWKQVAPTSYLNDLTGAVALHHAVDDDVVNIGYSRDLKALLDGADVENELYEYESGGHNIIGGSFVSAMQRTVDFYKKHLTE